MGSSLDFEKDGLGSFGRLLAAMAGVSPHFSRCLSFCVVLTIASAGDA